MVQLAVRNKVAEQKRHWIRLTRVCNQRCLFCHDRGNQNGRMLSYPQALNELKKGRRRGCSRAILSGGEPTLHPRLPQIIAQARRLGYRHIQLVTNGRMFYYGDFVKRLKAAGLDEVTLSLHSHKRKFFERLSGIKGSYPQAMKGLLNALENNFIVSVDIVINRINYKTLADTLKFFISLGVTEFDLLYLTPFGDAWKNKKRVYFHLRSAKKYLDKALELGKRPGICLWTNRLPAILLEGYEELIQHPCKLADEILGRERDFQLFIKSGRMLACWGKRCGHCFMNGFCQDLRELRAAGILVERSPARCLKRNGKRQRGSFRFHKNINIYKFLDFYIKCRYFIKSFRCQDCAWTRDCSGGQINEIREKGFKILTPVIVVKNCHGKG